MRIVVLYLGRKGAGPVYSIEMTKALLNRNVEILAVLSSSTENYEAWVKLKKDYAGLELCFVQTYSSSMQFLMRSFNILCFLKIVAWIKEWRPDYVYSTMAHFWDPIIMCLLPRNIKRIKTIHDVKLHTGEDSWISRFFHSFSFKQADKYIVLSKHYVNFLSDTKRIPCRNIIYIPHASFASYGQARISDQIFYKILFFGRISEYKGISVLLEAFELVLDAFPNIRLVVAGYGDTTPYEDRFRALSDNLDLKIGWIADNDVEPIVSDCDLVILPYVDASQSGVIPLAIGLGKPVIATAVGGLSDQVKNTFGLLVPSNDPMALAESIIKLYAEPSTIVRLSHGALEYSRKELSWDKSASTLLENLAV